MTTTAEESATRASSPDPVIDVELGGSVQPTRPDRSHGVGGPGRTRFMVPRFGLLSVFRFSLLMSFCMMLVIWLALLIIFLVLQAVGVTDTVAEWIGWRVNDTRGAKGWRPGG